MAKMSKDQYLLTKIAEEASEVAQIALKTQQFGPYEQCPDLPDNNLTRLKKEMVDLAVRYVNYLDHIGENEDFPEEWVERVEQKADHYYKYSQSLGMVE